MSSKKSQVFCREILGAHKLSGPVSVYGTSFIMLDFWRHDEADSVVTGDQANCVSKKHIEVGQSGD